MQSMPILLKHSLRSSLQLTRSSPVRAHFRPATPTFPITRPTPRSFSACVQCQFRRQPETYAAFDDKEKFPSEAEKVIKERELELGSRDPAPIPGVEVGSSHAAPPHTESDQTAEQLRTKESEVERRRGRHSWSKMPVKPRQRVEVFLPTWKAGGHKCPSNSAQ